MQIKLRESANTHPPLGHFLFVSGKEVPYFDYVEVLQQSSHLQMMYTGSSPTAGIVRPSPHVKIISPMT